MTSLLELIRKGGPAMIAILALSVVLYARCFTLLLTLRRVGRELQKTDASRQQTAGIDAPQLQRELFESFRHERIVLGAMIAAAPLLGLFGTVSGMVKTFDSLSSRSSEQSMEGLAHGISEVLVATESGLLVALPALALVYLALRNVNRHIAQLNRPAAGFSEKMIP